MATRRSKALQLFVYMSRTSARGTSAFLDGREQNIIRIAEESHHLLVRTAMYFLFSPGS